MKFHLKLVRIIIRLIKKCNNISFDSTSIVVYDMERYIYQSFNPVSAEICKGNAFPSVLCPQLILKYDVSVTI